MKTLILALSLLSLSNVYAKDFANIATTTVVEMFGSEGDVPELETFANPNTIGVTLNNPKLGSASYTVEIEQNSEPAELDSQVATIKVFYRGGN